VIIKKNFPWERPESLREPEADTNVLTKNPEKPFVTSSEKLIHTVNQQRRNFTRRW